ncbi:hypothetical protein MTR67_025123 [Solanum verrucosum]|uniref:Carnosine N-methyltransferase n=1 Tax=Solanum verrucosum TaxID=315347 RepID=A0AAF0QZ05_SOLVR|nr:hypothetical protein MTR67_025123 [Solanum verrucosum]
MVLVLCLTEIKWTMPEHASDLLSCWIRGGGSKRSNKEPQETEKSKDADAMRIVEYKMDHQSMQNKMAQICNLCKSKKQSQWSCRHRNLSRLKLGPPIGAGITEGFSMCGGDFVEVYSDPSQAGVWDAVVTCFFLDTAHNIVEYIEIISKVLKDGGVWINLGPLLYHFADMYSPEDEMSIDLSLEDVKRVALHYGFIFEKESTIETTYTTNLRSMMQVVPHIENTQRLIDDPFYLGFPVSRLPLLPKARELSILVFAPFQSVNNQLLVTNYSGRSEPQRVALLTLDSMVGKLLVYQLNRYYAAFWTMRKKTKATL